MPEIGEVARIVHYLRKHVVGKTIRAVRAQEDDIVYGKAGTSASAFQQALTGKKVVDARQQGKYFWLVMSEAPHPLMHFGMSGWIKFSNVDSAYYKPAAKGPEEQEWPPKYWKFVLEMEGNEKCEAAFVDARRLARIRLLDAPGEELRKVSPLKENGPDPVIDKDILTVEWLAKKMRSKRVPVKALLLDQANISGVGNWVGDEVLYQAKIHPEQYSNTFNDAQIKALHDSLTKVCTVACETLADYEKFPEDWLMRYRWGKGKKDAQKLPNGAKITFLKVGGRTSAVVPSVQKKTGDVAADIKGSDQDEDMEEEAESKPASKKGRAANPGTKGTAPNGAKRGRAKKEEEEVKEEDEEEGEEKPAPKKLKKGGVKKAAVEAHAAKNGNKGIATEPEAGRRRSLRNR